MFQAIGLTKSYRRGRPPAVLDLSFDACEGQVTALLGPEGSGRTTTLKLALGLERGQGAALFDGRPYRRIRRPEREVGTVLGEPGTHPGHPGRRARAHLRMVAAAAGVPARRADQLLEQTRLAPAAGHRLRTFSPGMNRRLALAEALLGDPGTLLLDEPTQDLSPKNVEWFHAFLRAFAASGGSVLVTVRSAQEAADLADRVVTLDGGRILADQSLAEFLGTRLRDEVSVCGPQVGRLADLLTEAGAQVRMESGARISVVGASRTEIGELAYQHGILLHELADRTSEAPARRIGRPGGAHAVSTASGKPTVSGTTAPVISQAAPVATAPAQPSAQPAVKHVIQAAAQHPTQSPTMTPVTSQTAEQATASDEAGGPGDTVVVLTPGGAVSASVTVPGAGPRTGRNNRVPAGLASVSGPLYRDEPGSSDDRSE